MNTPDNNDTSKEDQPSALPAIFKYVLALSLPTLSAASLITGGLIFWFYFFHIQYFPDLNVNESILFLLVAAITGAIILLLLAFLFTTPYLIRKAMLWEFRNSSLLRNKQKPFNELGGYFFSIFFFFWLSSLLFIYFGFNLLLILFPIIFVISYKIYIYRDLEIIPNFLKNLFNI